MQTPLCLLVIEESKEVKEAPPVGKKWWRIEFVRTAEWDACADKIRKIKGVNPFIKMFFDYVLKSSHFSYGTTVALSSSSDGNEVCEVLRENMMQLDRVETGAVGLMKSMCNPPL